MVLSTKASERDRYKEFIGKYVELTLNGSYKYGVYIGLTKDGSELQLLPSTVHGVREGVISYVWDNTLPTKVNRNSMQAIAPTTRETIDSCIEIAFQEQKKKNTQSS